MNSDLSRTIAVTGCGLVGSFGVGRDALWSSLEAGGIPFRPCSRYKTDLPTAEVPLPDLRRLGLRTSAMMRAPLISQFALVATQGALLEARRSLGDSIPSERIAIIYGTSNGPGVETQEIYEDLLNGGPSAVKPRVFQESVFNAPASFVSIQLGIKGPIITSPSGVAAGAYVLWQAEILLADENISAVIALCSDELCEGLQTGMHLVRYHAGPRSEAHPYDKRGNGFVMSEGACALVLERADRALARGAPFLAELAGVGCTNDAYQLAHNAPDGRGLSAAIFASLRDAEMSVRDVGLIISGAACTRADEIVENAALYTVFGETIPPVASSKGGIGLAMGASALFDAALAIEALRRFTLPPTPDHETLVSGVLLDIVTTSRPAPSLTAVLSTCINMNGLCGALIFRRASV